MIVGIGPDTDGPICGAGSQYLLLNADIQAQDTLAVETGDKVLKLVHFEGSLQVDLHLENLVGVRCK